MLSTLSVRDLKARAAGLRARYREYDDLMDRIWNDPKLLSIELITRLEEQQFDECSDAYIEIDRELVKKGQLVPRLDGKKLPLSESMLHDESEGNRLKRKKMKGALAKIYLEERKGCSGDEWMNCTDRFYAAVNRIEV